MHQELIEKAKVVLGEFQLAKQSLTAGAVGCALRTSLGNVYTGICLDLACGIGFCAEHAAIAEMLKARETVIDSIVAVSSKGVLMPCGRCRELLVQVSKENFKTKVVVDSTNHIMLSDLLPRHWM
ncbi:MAG: cytidine deaminase [Cyanobacteria bacterium J069]|nr:MAG: cytidine deaminase [Cyanobacteria bacterium J069]